MTQKVLDKSKSYANVFDVRKATSQVEVLRGVLERGRDDVSGYTLAELQRLTGYAEASISANLRHLRKAKYGSLKVVKERRDDGAWKYRIAS